MHLKESLGSAAFEDQSQSPNIEDRELVLAFKRGEDGSYQAIYERYSPRVSGICRRMLNQVQDAEEAQQETFIRVYTSLPKFNGRYQLGAWVSRIATNVCLDHIRSKGRKPADFASHEMLVDLSTDVDENVPEEELLKSDERQKVREVLATLSPSHRAALALREFEGMSYDDIAVALNMTEPQVKALIHRARKAFKKQWAPGLAAFLPWRWIAKARKFSTHYDAPPQLSDAAASTMHFASSCSAALQQCGQFVTERMATTVTALVVGTAAVGVVISPSAGDVSRSDDINLQAVDVGAQRADPRERSARGESGPKRQKVVVPPVPQGSVEEPEVQPAPAAQPTTAPSEPPPPPASEEKPASQPKPSSGAAALYTTFGWEDAAATPRAQATSSSLVVDCVNGSLTHEVHTMISHGALSYPLSLRVELSPAGTNSLSFLVQKDSRDIAYSSWGTAPTATWTIEDDTAIVEISGAYGARAGYDPKEAGLPESGYFDAMLTLDCAAQTVVTEGAVFTAE